MPWDNIQEKYISRDNDFYRRYYPYFIMILMGALLILLLTLGLVIYQISHRPEPVFNAVQPDGKTMELSPYDMPNLLPDTILRWASKAATIAYTFDYVNYQQQLSQIRPYFTDDGWKDYNNSLAGLIDRVVSNQLFVNGVVRGTPVISNQGPLPGVSYAWRVQIPFLVTYQSASSVLEQKYYIVLTIVRVPTSVNPQGIGIDRFVTV